MPLCIMALMKVALGVALAVIAVVLVWYLTRGSDSPHATAAPSASAPGSASPKPGPIERVKKVTHAERNELAKQIAAARAGRAAPAAPAGPSLPAGGSARPHLPEGKLDPGDVDSFKTTFKSAMKDVVPYLAECLDKHSAVLPQELNVRAKLNLTGDPDIGTIIDTDGLTDDKDGPLQQEFDLCVRDALAGLELPPLAEGEQVRVTYPFLFSR